MPVIERQVRKAGYHRFVFFFLIYGMISATFFKKVPKQKTMEGNTSNLNNDCLCVVGLRVVIFLPYFDLYAFFRFL